MFSLLVNTKQCKKIRFQLILFFDAHMNSEMTQIYLILIRHFLLRRCQMRLPICKLMVGGDPLGS